MSLPLLALAACVGTTPTAGTPTGAPPAPATCGAPAGTAAGGTRVLGDVDVAGHELAQGESAFLGFVGDRDGDGSPDLLVSTTEPPPADTGLFDPPPTGAVEVHLLLGPVAGTVDAADAVTTLYDPRDAPLGAILADADLDADGACDLLLDTFDGARLIPSLPAGRVDVGGIGVLALANGDWWSPGDATGDGIADLVGAAGEVVHRIPGPITGAVDLAADADLAIRDPDGLPGLDAVADIDGDGAADWLVETYRARGYELGSFLGPSGELVFDDADARVRDVAQAAVLPDADGDGIAELLLSPPLGATAEVASAALPAGVSDLASVSAWSIVDGARSSVGRITPADLDQDGIGDLLVDGGCEAASCQSVIWGPLPTGGVHEVADLAQTRILTASARPVGDVDGDGWGDLVTTDAPGGADWSLVSGAALAGP